MSREETHQVFLDTVAALAEAKASQDEAVCRAVYGESMRAAMTDYYVAEFTRWLWSRWDEGEDLRRD